jgi:hypothetical protein
MTKPLPPDQKKPKGGPRANSGRPKGSATIRTREVADKLMAEEDITPLEVMVRAMRELWNTGAIEGRMAAAEIAQKAAPYVHPRLSSIEANVNVSRHEDMLDQLDPDGSL